MITAVDTSVLLDVLGADPTFGFPSKEVLPSCIAQGRLVVCDVVWADVIALAQVLKEGFTIHRFDSTALDVIITAIEHVAHFGNFAQRTAIASSARS